MHANEDYPQVMRVIVQKVFDLRYGENHLQHAALYSDGTGRGVAGGRQLQGKELSYNNIVDMQAAWDLAHEFSAPACAKSQAACISTRSEEHTSELQSHLNLVCRLLLEKKK